MSCGSPIVCVRFSAIELHLLDQLIERANLRTRKEPYNRSTFLKKLVNDECKHIERARRASQRRRPGYGHYLG